MPSLEAKTSVSTSRRADQCRPSVLSQSDADTRCLRFVLDLAPNQGQHVMPLLTCQQPHDLTAKLSVGAGHSDPHGDLTSFHRRHGGISLIDGRARSKYRRSNVIPQGSRE